MPTGTRFSSDELAEVLSHYDIGKIRKVMRLVGGSKRAPKIVVTTTKGRFLLKRRFQGKDDVYRVAFAHAVQTHLAKRYFPIAPLVTTRDEVGTILQLRGNIYELFKFVGGSRYKGSAEETIDTGRQLAKFHQYLEQFQVRVGAVEGELPRLDDRAGASQDRRVEQFARSREATAGDGGRVDVPLQLHRACGSTRWDLTRGASRSSTATGIRAICFSTRANWWRCWISIR